MPSDSEFEQSTPDSLPASATRVVLSSMEEVRQQIVAVTRQAERSLAIYTKVLEAEIYEQASFVEALKRLVLARPFARVRILLAEHDVHDKHPLFVMAARLPSLMEIRAMPMRQYDASVFVVADERAVVYRMHCTRWDGMADMQDQPVAKMYLGKFEQAWAESVSLSPLLAAPSLRA